jgi:hypothetical protein
VFTFFLVTPAAPQHIFDTITKLPLYKHESNLGKVIVGLPTIEYEPLYMVPFAQINGHWALGEADTDDTQLLWVNWRIRHEG